MRAVLDATIATIVEQGTTLISVEDVASRANVNKTTIYRRWPTREELVLAAIIDHADTAIPIPDTGRLRDDLLELAALVRDSLASTTGRVLQAATRPGADPRLDELRERFWNERLGAAAMIVERGIGRGECQAGPSADTVIEQLVAPIHFRMFVLGRHVGDARLGAIVDSVLQVLAATSGSR